MKIYKYTLKVVEEQTISLPKGAIILTVQAQNSFFISLWAIVDPNMQDKEYVTFEIIGTGNEISLRPRVYISTVQMGILVWHIFQINNHQQ